MLRRPAVFFRGVALWLAVCGTIRAALQDEAVIRMTTNLVEVRVVAEDSHNKPVADLKKSDFEILDNKQRQRRIGSRVADPIRICGDPARLDERII